LPTITAGISVAPRAVVVAKRDALGFSLIEVLVVAGIASVIMGAAIPAAMSQMRMWALNSTIQTVGAQIRSARYSAVSKNRTLRVRFNCPAANQYRIVEVVGSSGIDNDANRCSETAYPYPDPNSAAAPNLDGPVMRLPEGAQFGTVQDLEINTTGRVTPLAGCPTCAAAAPPATLNMANLYATRTITVTAGGQVLLP